MLMAYRLNQAASEKAQRLFEKAEKISAEQISAKANLRRLTRQREEFRAQDWSSLAANYEHSVFYQLDLDDAAHDFARLNIAEPEPLPSDASLLTRMRDAMFRSELERLNGDDGEKNESRAFALLRDALTIPTALGGENRTMTNTPQLQVASDQIVWARSPVRIDIAGGWTDTPPYCLMEGGNVINFAIELNGQPPIQAFVKPCQDYHVVLRSIDLGATEVVSTYEDLAD